VNLPDLGQRRIILLTAGHTDHGRAKTAVNLLRYKPSEVVGILDPSHAGQSAQSVFGIGGEVPVRASFDDLPPANIALIGIAPSGGRLTSDLRQQVVDAIQHRLHIVSGLHQFLNDDPELASHARKHGVLLQDVRKNMERDVANRSGLRSACLRVHTVGHDCNVGKMLVSVELTQALRKIGVDAKFVATGQTGIMIEGEGCPVDAVVADFLNGAAEKLVLAHQHHAVLMIEGQGSLTHPRYSAVTLGLLHGCMPDALILCYEMGRTHVSGMDGIPLRSLNEFRVLYETMANLSHPCRVIGIAMNSRRFTTSEAAAERDRVQSELGLPVCDVLRDGPSALVEAIFNRSRELGHAWPPPQ